MTAILTKKNEGENNQSISRKEAEMGMWTVFKLGLAQVLMYLKGKVLLFGCGNKGFSGHWCLIKQDDNFLTEKQVLLLAVFSVIAGTFNKYRT